MRPKFLALFCLCGLSLLLAGCSNDTPQQTADNNQDTFLISDAVDPLAPDTTASGTDTALDQNLKNGATKDMAECTTKNEQLVTALQENTTALKACEEEKQKLGEQTRGAAAAPADTRYQKFISFYLEKASLSEFPFPKCGGVAAFSSEAWFTDFKNALAAAAIPFGRTTLATSDLSGGCASQEGKMAFFLGAENDILSEFHLVKFDFQSGKVVEGVLADGTCGDSCPKQVGVRKGPYLTLTGQAEGGAKSTYRYYYADNLLKRE